MVLHNWSYGIQTIGRPSHLYSLSSHTSPLSTIFVFGQFNSSELKLGWRYYKYILGKMSFLILGPVFQMAQLELVTKTINRFQVDWNKKLGIFGVLCSWGIYWYKIFHMNTTISVFYPSKIEKTERSKLWKNSIVPFFLAQFFGTITINVRIFLSVWSIYIKLGIKNEDWVPFYNLYLTCLPTLTASQKDIPMLQKAQWEIIVPFGASGYLFVKLLVLVDI